MSNATVCDVPVRRSDLRLRPDPSRVVTQLFVAGEELPSGSSRANPVMQRVLSIDESAAEALLEDILVRFDSRHPDLRAQLLKHFERIKDRLEFDGEVSLTRRLLLGAYATNEYAIEATSLCNPSIVAHPDQEGLGPGELRFVLSLRAVGEGHISSIEFRTGTIGPTNEVQVDDPGRLLVAGEARPSIHDKAQFGALLDQAVRTHEISARIFDGLPRRFSGYQLDAAIDGLHREIRPRPETRELIDRIRAVAASNYTLSFPADSSIGERVIQPHGPFESRGMEDARFVRFVNEDGSVVYYATYTAFDGSHIAPQLMVTTDFRTFVVTQLAGQAATNKGMALFPRKIGGRYVALSRWDRETVSVTTSQDAHCWDDHVVVHGPEQPWELFQVGNCGSPIETEEGWLVLTHGVGPMRTYSLGAVLLDLDDPTLVIGKLTEPLLSADSSEREGYVPNVVYTCGALLHGDTLVLPYAYGDSITTFASVWLPDLLKALRA